MAAKQNLKIALQKRGRLSEDSLALLRQCGISFSIQPSSLIVSCNNFPLDILFVRDDDIPTLVNSGIADFGIVGENVLYEQSCRQKYNIVQTLGFCNCRLSIALPQKTTYKGIQSLNGKSIATSYPTLLSSYLTSKKIDIDIVTISGSVELAPRIGMADAICDLVSSGRTLSENNLLEREVILESEAVLIQSMAMTAKKKQFLQRSFISKIRATQYRRAS